VAEKAGAAREGVARSGHPAAREFPRRRGGGAAEHRIWPRSCPSPPPVLWQDR